VGPVEPETTEPPVQKDHALGALLAVTGVSFVIGLLAQRRIEQGRKPSTRIREGISGLGEELAGMWKS
jgi:hypothetical protein